MISRRYLLPSMLATTIVVGAALAQRRVGGGGSRFGGSEHGYGWDVDPATVDRSGVPVWDVDPHFKSDLFTFVRIRFNSRYRTFAWEIDFPYSDINFVFRLQQLTNMKVAPHTKILDLTDERLLDYPFIYMMEVGDLVFSDEEVVALRRYLLNGGFLMVDDHWGLDEQENWKEQIARVFPDRPMTELTIDHPIFHCVFDLKKIPQIPGISSWRRFQQEGDYNPTWERNDDPNPHYRAIYDDKGRMMMLQCANTDLGDGWEREGEEQEYFHKFSETQAYPMGVNIVFYAMTH